MSRTSTIPCEIGELDGLPVLTGARDGPVEAALVFRTGFVDETAPRYGLTHLLEHLAFGPKFPAETAAGVVTQTSTVFMTEGRDNEVVDWLVGLSRRLARIPLERLAVERRILDVEEQNAGFSGERKLLLMHYGYQGPGLAGCRELGLRSARPQELKELATRCFGSANAALVLSRPLDGLAGLPLPVGERRPVPPAAALPRPSGAAELADVDAPLAMGAPMEDDAAAAVLGRIIERLAWKRLRHERGLFYDLRCRLERVGPAERFLSITCDALDRDAQEVASGLLALIDELARAPVARSVLQDGVDDFERRIRSATFASLVSTAQALLVRGRPRTPDEAIALAAAVDAVAVQQAAVALRARLLVSLPEGTTLGLPTLRHDDGPGPDRQGSGGGRLEPELIVGEEGVSVLDRGVLRTVRYDRCVAVVREPFGALVLLGANGTEVRVDPIGSPHRADVLAAVETALDPRLFVPEDDLLPPRRAAATPRTQSSTSPSMRVSTWLAGQVRQGNDTSTPRRLPDPPPGKAA